MLLKLTTSTLLKPIGIDKTWCLQLVPDCLLHVSVTRVLSQINHIPMKIHLNLLCVSHLAGSWGLIKTGLYYALNNFTLQSSLEFLCTPRN